MTQLADVISRKLKYNDEQRCHVSDILNLVTFKRVIILRRDERTDRYGYMRLDRARKSISPKLYHFLTQCYASFR